MSYTEYDDNGVKVFLCWNCGKIHLEESETQHEGVDMDFITRHLDKARKVEEEKKRVSHRG